MITTLIGTDGDLLPEPVDVTSLQISPGERVEIVVTMSPGERAVLRSDSPDLGIDFFTDRFSGGDDRFDHLQLRAAAELAPSPDLPARLATAELPYAADAVRTREFELSGSSRINGESFDMARIDTVVAVDTTEIWQVTNRADMPHNFHVHDVQFRILSIDGEPPPSHLEGPKDTVWVRPGSTVGIALSFADYADAETPYVYHCHILRHEDRGLMGQFIVVDPKDVDTA